MSQRTKPPFRADQVGSLLRSAPVVRRAAQDVYDSYLKANRVERGIEIGVAQVREDVDHAHAPGAVGVLPCDVRATALAADEPERGGSSGAARGQCSSPSNVASMPVILYSCGDRAAGELP